MSRLLLEKNIEQKLIPNTLKRNSIKELYENPTELARNNAEKMLKNIKISIK